MTVKPTSSPLWPVLGLFLACIWLYVMPNLVYVQDSRQLVREEQERQATLEGMTLGFEVQKLLDDHVQEEDLVAAINNLWTSRPDQGDLTRVDVLQLNGAKLLGVWSAEPGASGSLPRRLAREEKDFFDQAKAIKTAIDTNREAKLALKEERLLRYPSPSSLQILLPLFHQDQVMGVIRLEQRVSVPDQSFWTFFPQASGVMLVFLMLCAMVFSLGRRGEGHLKVLWSATVGISLLLILAGIAYTGILAKSFETERTRVESELFLKEQRLLSLLADPTLPSGTLDIDAYRRPFHGDDHGLLAVRTQIAFDQTNQHFQRMLALAMVCALACFFFFTLGLMERLLNTLWTHREAYVYISPAILGMLILVFFPFFYGIMLSVTNSDVFNSGAGFSEIFVGLENFGKILFDFDLFARAEDGSRIINYENFYWTLYITIMWTACNVTIGVSLGLILALALNVKGLRGKTVYRILLILPWAIPNYITALIWRGMFHKQFGVFNQVIQMFGGESVPWFDGVFTSFLTGIATNGWLSFPFMMVMCLGGLQSISSDMYEAARLDGASRIQQFFYITLPSLKIVLVPAIIISVVWTFNMFNIIFLVSGGEPGGANEILITKAYKIAFEQYRYGYAAAYSVVIFILLLVYGMFQVRTTKALEASR
jgi:arabinogalactan oligomer/maltooligosaccharide transport system permease protein